MPTRASITYPSGPPSRRLGAATRAVKEALWSAIQHWHATYAPKHFTAAGGREYGYQRRSGEDESAWVYSNRGRGMEVTRRGVSRRLIKNPKYYWRKKREGHGTDPLVRTGLSKEMALAGIRKARTARSDFGLVSQAGAMDVPTYFYQRLKAGTYSRGDTTFTIDHDTPDKYRELTTTTEPERQALQRIVENQTVAALRARGPSHTVRVATRA